MLVLQNGTVYQLNLTVLAAQQTLGSGCCELIEDAIKTDGCWEPANRYALLGGLLVLRWWDRQVVIEYEPVPALCKDPPKQDSLRGLRAAGLLAQFDTESAKWIAGRHPMSRSRGAQGNSDLSAGKTRDPRIYRPAHQRCVMPAQKIVAPGGHVALLAVLTRPRRNAVAPLGQRVLHRLRRIAQRRVVVRPVELVAATTELRARQQGFVAHGVGSGSR